jgi:hypothetical protein
MVARQVLYIVYALLDVLICHLLSLKTLLILHSTDPFFKQVKALLLVGIA